MAPAAAVAPPPPTPKCGGSGCRGRRRFSVTRSKHPSLGSKTRSQTLEPFSSLAVALLFLPRPPGGKAAAAAAAAADAAEAAPVFAANASRSSVAWRRAWPGSAGNCAAIGFWPRNCGNHCGTPPGKAGRWGACAQRTNGLNGDCIDGRRLVQRRRRRARQLLRNGPLQPPRPRSRLSPLGTGPTAGDPVLPTFSDTSAPDSSPAQTEPRV
eukprot:331059-Chlamydomonas_euryale.AAC.4